MHCLWGHLCNFYIEKSPKLVLLDGALFMLFLFKENELLFL
ncbi:hypothetical protein FM107_18100 [Sphingobacterium sp. JB170]|nr:hypothetical protein FM107_18100 [Sphingobacterium sp. JB170]